MLNDILKAAITYGMGIDEYFHSTPRDIYMFLEIKRKEREQENEFRDKERRYVAWMNGIYVMRAISAVIHGNKSKYPDNPIMDDERNTKYVATEDMSEEEKNKLRGMFLNNLLHMQDDFNRSKGML